MDPDAEALLRAVVTAQWGDGTFLQLMAPSMAADPRHAETCGRYERYSVGPQGMELLWSWTRAVDLRSLLPAIHVPTLVLRRSDELAPRRSSEYLAEHIDGARRLEVPGADHLPWLGDARAVVDAIEEFITGTRSQPAATDDGVLATVLFTDIVGSTEQVARHGDRRWRELLDAHDELARREVDRFRGRVVQTTGDGILAAFDGPARAIRCARAITTGATALGLAVRSGLHTGECEQRGADLAGITLHIGSRVASMAGPGEVLVTSTVRDLVFGAGFELEDRGAQELRGVPGSWQVLAVVAER